MLGFRPGVPLARPHGPQRPARPPESGEEYLRKVLEAKPHIPFDLVCRRAAEIIEQTKHGRGHVLCYGDTHYYTGKHD